MEFEKAFALEDDSEGPSGANTPSMQSEKALTSESGAPTSSGSAESEEKGEEKPASSATRPSSELSPEVRSKLRKLETLESKYKGLSLESVS